MCFSRKMAAVGFVLGLLVAVVSAQTDVCKFQIGTNTYDLTPLKNRTYAAPNTRYTAYTEYIAVCGETLQISGCASNAAVCEKGSTGAPGTTVGIYPATFSESPSLVMKYSPPAGICLIPIFQFICDVNANEDPVYVSETSCEFVFSWRTKYACPITVSDDVPSKLIDLALSESLALTRLTEMTNKYGNRLSGTAGLEKSIDWVLNKMMSEDKFDNVYTENVKVPVWQRGVETARITTPLNTTITILGLGMSNGTGPNGVVGSVMVVKSFEELTARASEVPGKIVLFNAPYVNYALSSTFRRTGPQLAAQYGAVAALVRSVSPFSLYTPHTGSMVTCGIPGASVTHEDADQMERWINNGETVRVFLYMEATFLADTVSRNIIAELYGSTYPNQFVVMGGHIDSWDVGTGALDDGGGAFVSWDALRLMAKYNYRPKRTIRVVFWTNEENGANGARQYKENHEAELPFVSWAFESDAGVFNPSGIGFTGSEAAFDILTNIGATYLTRINAGEVVRGGGGTDIEPMCLTGVPCSGLNMAIGRREDKTDSYFNFHHTKADTVTALRANEVALCTASMAAWTYAVADLDILLPRN